MELATYRSLRSSVRRRSRWLGFVVALVATAIVAVVGVSVYVGWNLSHAPRKALDDDPSRLSLVYEDVQFPATEDEVLLRGWFLPSGEGSGDGAGSDSNSRFLMDPGPKRQDSTIVIAHGFRGNRLESGVPALGLAASLVDAGFNVLMFDFRNSGESEGNVTTLGYHEVKDILGAIAWLQSERSEASRRIGLVGYSMGAVTSALAAAREPIVGAIVLDSPFADLRPYLRENMPHWTGLPGVPFTWTIMTLLPPLIGLDMDAVSPLQAMPQIAAATLLIHTSGDEAIPASNSEQLAAVAQPQRTELWIVPGTAHIGARAVNPNAYDNRIIRFFSDALVGGQGS